MLSKIKGIISYFRENEVSSMGDFNFPFWIAENWILCVVLFVVIRHWSWVHWVWMRVINLTNSVPPASNHCVLLCLNLDGDPVVLEEHVDHVNVQKAHPVLPAENFSLPVHVTNWVFHKSTDVLESSPFLSLISWFFSALDELCKIAISVSG